MKTAKKKIDWNPPFTPFSLLQEKFWPDRWKVAVICLFLNRTRKSVAEPIIEKFFLKFPNNESYIKAYEWKESRDDILDLIASLGFKNKRAEKIYDLSIAFCGDVKELYEIKGIGEYADTCDKIFFSKEFENTPPKDGVLANV